jgi:hypothetical protein
MNECCVSCSFLKVRKVLYFSISFPQRRDNLLSIYILIPQALIIHHFDTVLEQACEAVFLYPETHLQPADHLSESLASRFWSLQGVGTEIQVAHKSSEVVKSFVVQF